jgi:hypothetical protein
MCKIKRGYSAKFLPTAPLQLRFVCGLERCTKTAPNLTRNRCVALKTKTANYETDINNFYTFPFLIV